MKRISIRTRIYWSFALLVLLFVVNGVVTIITLTANKKMANHISLVMDPSLQAAGDFSKLMIESRMYATNWVFLRSNELDKNSLQEIHNIRYRKVKDLLTGLSSQWHSVAWCDSLSLVYQRFEQILSIEKQIMGSLQRFGDYDDPVIKLEMERILEDEVLPRTTVTINMLNRIIVQGQNSRLHEQAMLDRSSKKLRILIALIAVLIIFAGIILSLKMAKSIITPINRISHIVNDLGKGITRKIKQENNADEIGKMIRSVNNLSEKLQGTANFAREIGLRNFDIPFQPLSEEDTLGKALIAMRDNLKTSDGRLLEANAEIQTIYDASPDAVIVLDQDGKIVKWDYKAELLFGWKEREVLSQSLIDFIIPSRFHKVHERGLKRLLTSNERAINGKTIEVSVIKKNNSEFEISLSIAVSLIKGKYRFIGFLRDITPRKKAEAEMQQKNKELEQFAYVASHDLQEPLRTISSFVELFQKQYLGKLDARADKYLTYIVQASDRMKVLIKDLLDYSRIGNKRELQNVDCNTVLTEVLADIGAAIKEGNAVIEVEELPVISAYPTEIKQLFQNLITNAIKFRKKTEPPHIQISAHTDDGCWTFTVKDNGIGIEEEHQDRVFNIFQRLHTRNEYEGSGIGLAHCKKIVGLHGGKIWINSTPGEGTNFHFTILQNTSNEKKTELHFARR